MEDACGGCVEDLAKWRTHVTVAWKIWRNGGRMWRLRGRFGEMEDACGGCVEDLAKWRTHVAVAWKIWRHGGRMWRLRGRFGEMEDACGGCVEDLVKSQGVSSPSRRGRHDDQQMQRYLSTAVRNYGDVF